MLLRYFATNDIHLDGKRVLDLGSGIGGYSKIFSAAGADVISVDLMADRIAPLEQSGARISASAVNLPLADETIDMVFCASLIEHVEQPEGVIAEITRVLKPRGYCYLSFPPFYSWRGGHEYAPYHYLGERLALRIVGTHANKYHPEWIQGLYQVSNAPQSFSGIYADWGLYVMTISKAKRIISESNLRIIDLSTRFMPFSFVRWPILGEFLTWHVQFLLQRKT